MINLVKLRLNQRLLRKLGRGQTMVEYSLILAAIAVLVFVSYTATGRQIANLVSWGSIHNDLLGL